MSHYIGDVEVPAINELEPDKGKQSVDENKYLGLDDPIVIEHPTALEEVKISAFLHSALHSDSMDVGLQRENLRSLLMSDKAGHSFDYIDNWAGWLSVSEVDVPRAGDSSTLISATITAKYLPNGEYQRGIQPGGNQVTNDFGISRPGLITLPASVDNVKVKNPQSKDELPLTSIATQTTEDGNLDVYRLFGWYEAQGGTLSGGAALDPQTEASGLQEVALNAQNEAVQFVEDDEVPDGNYKLVARIRDDNEANDIRLKVEEYDGSTWSEALNELASTGTSSYTYVTSSEFAKSEDQIRVAIEKDGSVTNYIEVDGAYLEPQFNTEILFDVEVGRTIDRDAALWLKLDEGSGSTAEDSSPNQYDGTLQGDASFSSNGVSLDGNGDYIDVPDDDPLWISDDITIIAKVTPQDSKNMSIARAGYGQPSYSFNLAVNNIFTFNWYDDDNGSYVTQVGGGSYSTGNTYTAAATRSFSGDTATVELFVDGSSVASDTRSSPNPSVKDDSGGISIGYDNSGAQYFDGTIHWVAIFPKVLTQTEIQNFESDQVDSIKSFNVPDRQAPVRVYDDNGSNTESDWDRVQNVEHVFDDGIVIENGMIRTIVDDTITFYSYESNSWEKIYNGGSADFNNLSMTIKELSNEKSILRISGFDRYNDEWILQLTLREGKQYNEYFIDKTGTHNSLYCSIVDNTYKYRADSDTIAHRLPSDSGGYDNLTADLDNWEITFSELEPRLIFIGTNKNDSMPNLRDHNGNDVDEFNLNIANSLGATFYVGIIPFPETANLHTEAEDVTLPAGADVNHWEMPLGTSGNLDEFSGDVADYTEDTANSEIDVSGAGSGAGSLITLNALQFGATQASNDITMDVRVDAEGSVPGLGPVWGYSDAGNFYHVRIRTDKNMLQLYKWVGGTATQLATPAHTFNIGTTYTITVDWDPSTGSIDIYVDDETKSGSPVISHTDSSHDSGQVGIRSFDADTAVERFIVDAWEVTSSGNSAQIITSDAIQPSGQITQTVIGNVDLPLGVYLAAIRYKSTNPNHNMVHNLYNTTDGTSPAIDGNGTQKNITNTQTYQYDVREMLIDDTGDSYVNYYNTQDSTNVAHTAIDEMILIPVSMVNQTDRLGPQDIMHEAMRDMSQPAIVRER